MLSSIPIISILLSIATISFNQAFASEAGREMAIAKGCVHCHDPEGKTDHPQAPYLGGQKKSYLIKQLQSFRRKTPKLKNPYRIFERQHPIMDPQSVPLNKREITLLADYFSRQRCFPYRPKTSKKLTIPEKGKRCVFCHGPSGVNPYSIYPNIGGQKMDYMVVQLKAFRKSARDGMEHGKKDKRFHRMMAPIVLDLNDEEIEDIANYYSRQSCR